MARVILVLDERDLSRRKIARLLGELVSSLPLGAKAVIMDDEGRVSGES